MRKSTLVLSIALAASVAINLSAVGAFVVRRVTKSRRPTYHWARRARPESRDEVRKLQRALEGQMDSLRQELAEEQRGLAELLRQDEAPGVEVDSAAARIGRLHAAMTRQAFDFTRETLQKLTPEQQEYLLRKFERQYDRRRGPGRDGRRHGPRSGRWSGRHNHGACDSEPPPPEPPDGGQ
jgi:hypothetical protein